MKLEISRQVFEKSSNIKFRENPSSGSRVISCGRTDGRTDVKKLIFAFRNFANASKNRDSKGLHFLNSTRSSLTQSHHFYNASMHATYTACTCFPATGRLEILCPVARDHWPHFVTPAILLMVELMDHQSSAVLYR